MLGVIILLAAVDIGHRAMIEMTRRPGDRPDAARAKVTPSFGLGDRAPDFELPDKSGKTRRLSELVREPTMLCFLCGCSDCRDMQTYMAKLLPKLGARAPKIIGVTTASEESEEAWIRDTKLKQTMLYEQKGGKVMGQYRGHPCPRIFQLTSRGTVQWIGPSPAVEPILTNHGGTVALQMGFKLPGDPDKNNKRPVAPPLHWSSPTARNPAGGAAAPAAIGPGASVPAGHSAGDGHGH